MNVICEICQEKIAEAKADDIRLPLKGSQFLSPDSRHGFPPPFDPEAEWEDMRCPYCRRRPFLRRDSILTSDGVLWIRTEAEPQAVEKMQQSETSEAEAIVCEECGKTFKHRLALGSHLRMHQRRREAHGDR